MRHAVVECDGIVHEVVGGVIVMFGESFPGAPEVPTVVLFEMIDECDSDEGTPEYVGAQHTDKGLHCNDPGADQPDTEGHDGELDDHEPGHHDVGVGDLPVDTMVGVEVGVDERCDGHEVVVGYHCESSEADVRTELHEDHTAHGVVVAGAAGIVIVAWWH